MNIHERLRTLMSDSGLTRISVAEQNYDGRIVEVHKDEVVIESEVLFGFGANNKYHFIQLSKITAVIKYFPSLKELRSLRNTAIKIT